MRVLAVVNWDPVAKHIPWAMQRIDALRTAGVEIELLYEDCLTDRRRFFRLWRRLNRRLTEKRFDLVAPLYGSVLGLLCAVQRQAPCALSLAGSDLNGTPGGSPFSSALSMVASQLAVALAGGTSVCGPHMKQKLWWPSARLTARFIPDGIDTRRFRPRPREEARRLLGLPPEGVRIAFVSLGGDRSVKRIDLARSAVARIPGATLDVFERVPFDAMPLAYAATDALVVTSFSEGSPNCVREALACGIPVVSVEVGDVRSMLEGLSNCAIVPAQPQAIADALAAALRDGRGCPEGPAKMSAERSIEAAAQSFLRFYQEVALGA